MAPRHFYYFELLQNYSGFACAELDTLYRKKDVIFLKVIMFRASDAKLGDTPFSW